MAEIVNLRQARKQKRRKDAQQVAEANRLVHGRTKAEKKQDKASRALHERHLDGHKRCSEKTDP